MPYAESGENGGDSDVTGGLQLLARKTVLVIGAGAGVEFAMPIGKSLIQTVRRDTNFPSLRREAGTACRVLWSAVQDPDDRSGNEAMRAGAIISEGAMFADSIDDFLYVHGDDARVVQVGKAAIAGAILKAESGSKLRGLGSFNIGHHSEALQEVSDCWLHQLINRLVPGVRTESRNSLFNNLTIINFNYDRCVEIYLHAAVQRLFAISSSEATALMRTLQIYHPYGTIGRLPWQEGPGPEVQFGLDIERADLAAMGRNIRTLTEQVEDGEAHAAWRQAVHDCEVLVGVGFAFHRQNVKLITSADRDPNQHHPVYAYATGFQESDEQCALFKDRLVEIKASQWGEAIVKQVDCKTFMRDLGGSIFR